MRSGTSYFNLTLLRKNLTRYWPLWAGYALIWVYALPVRCLLQQGYAWDTPRNRVFEFARGIPALVPNLGLFLAVVFGLLMAAAMFSYLYNSRSAGLMHALPIRREGLFLTCYVSGLVCLLGPHLLVWVLTVAAQAPVGYVNLYTVTVWALAQSALCVIFYSMAVFCALFTGHILALPVFYGVLNAAVAIVTTLLEQLCRAFLYGFAVVGELGSEVLMWLTPVVRIVRDVEWYRSEAGGGGRLGGVWVLVIYVAVSLVLAGAALLIYRRRHVETAGDVVAVPILRPVFKYGVALCSGLCLGYLLNEMFPLGGNLGLAVSLLLWTAIGYFAAEMLLRKSFRVLDAWKGCAAALAAMAVCIALVGLDVTGFSGRVPAQRSVVSVRLNAGHTVPYDSGAYVSLDRITDPDAVERILRMHQAVVADRDSAESQSGGGSSWMNFEVEYTLSGGRKLHRMYNLPVREGTPLAEAARELLCAGPLEHAGYQLDQVLPNRLTGFVVEDLGRDLRTVEGEGLLDTPANPNGNRDGARRLWEAVQADFAAGTLGRRYLFDASEERMNDTCVADLILFWSDRPTTAQSSGKTWRSDSNSLRITLTPQAEHTLAVLRELGVLKEKDDLISYGEFYGREKYGYGSEY